MRVPILVCALVIAACNPSSGPWETSHISATWIQPMALISTGKTTTVIPEHPRVAIACAGDTFTRELDWKELPFPPVGTAVRVRRGAWWQVADVQPAHSE